MCATGYRRRRAHPSTLYPIAPLSSPSTENFLFADLCQVHHPSPVVLPCIRSRQHITAMAVPDTSKRIAEAEKLAKTDPSKAEQIYKEVLSTNPGSNEAAIKNYESALVGLGELFRDQRRVDALAELVRQTRSVLSSFAKAKTAKLGTHEDRP